jgi:FtsZ-interacting cell division protein ZipA
MKNDKKDYLKIIVCVIAIIVLIVIVIINNKNNKSQIPTNLSSSDILVRDSSINDTQNNQSQNNSNLGPATVQDLGGNNGSGNIDQLLEGKNIDL